MSFSLVDLLCFLIYVLVSGDAWRSLVVGCWTVFHCKLYVLCMLLSHALTLVKKKIYLAYFASLLPRISRRGITSGIRAQLATLGSLCYAPTMILYLVDYDIMVFFAFVVPFSMFISDTYLVAP